MYYKKLIISGFTALSLLGVATLAQAQTASTTDPVTPGAPNTGAGGDATQNLLVLGASGLVALAGAGYLLRARKAHSN